MEQKGGHMDPDPKESSTGFGQAIAKIFTVLTILAIIAGMIPPHLQERAGMWIGSLYQQHIKPGSHLLSRGLMPAFASTH